MAHTTEDEENDELPKVNRFTVDLTNWLTVVSILFFTVYAILLIVYEIALELAQIRWVFIGFLACCVIDVIAYWICRFAVQDPSMGEKCLLIIVLISQCATGLFYLIAPIVALCTFRLIPEVSVNNRDQLIDDDTTIEKEDSERYTFEEYVNPCSSETGNRKENDEQMWECGYVNSVYTACWWMILSIFPKFLMGYLIFRLSGKK